MALSGLSCNMQDLCWIMWCLSLQCTECMGFSSCGPQASCSMAFGILVPQPGLNLHPLPAGFPGCASGKDLENAADMRDVSSIPGSGRSPGEGPGNTLQYSCLENSMDRGGWQATVHRVTKSWTQHAHTLALQDIFFTTGPPGRSAHWFERRGGSQFSTLLPVI